MTKNRLSKNRPIYLDYMATTPVDPAVMEAMLPCLRNDNEAVFGNSASRSHCYGHEADACIDEARQQVAALINADPREIIWTSGATESDNLAIKGVAGFYHRKGKHIITLLTEHKAVLDTCRYLETQGFVVTYLKPQADGLLNLSSLRSAIRPDTILISIMHANNETGVIQDIAAIAKIAHQAGIVFHSDAAQSAGKTPIDVRAMQVDLLSLSGHKLYGPKGIGALFVSRSPRIRLAAQIHGGAQQQGLRSGTLPTHQIVGMGKAFVIAKEHFAEDNKRIEKLRHRLWKGISQLSDIQLNGNAEKSLLGCLNFGIHGVDAESLLIELNEIAISSGSACNSAVPEPSQILLAMGLSREAANRSIRLSLGRFTTEAEIDKAISHIVTTVKRLRERPSLWGVAQQEALKDKKEKSD